MTTALPVALQHHGLDRNERQTLGDGQVLAVGAGGHHDGVACCGSVDRLLDGGVTAVPDQQDIGGAGAVDLFDARERVGALGTPRTHHEVAEPVTGDHRGRDARGVTRRVGSGSARERVVAARAGEDVVAAVAGDGVGVAVAGAVDIAAAGQRQVLDIGAQCVGHRRLHGVGGAFVERLRHRIAHVVDDVGVVAGAAVHGIGARAAVERVVAAAADQRVAAGAAGEGVTRRQPLLGDDRPAGK
jgi:hypothetical protein